jgi:hypothetical protein
MTPKEKADIIFQQMYKILWHTNADPIHCKECALIAVDLRLEGDFIFTNIEYAENSYEYWKQVKNEINKR